jgi:glycosyltransferase involved in cell wall biosynthesis
MLVVGSLTYHFRYVESLRKLIRKKGLDSHIILTGEIPDEELCLYYGACDGFIFPSDGRQSWGLAIFEAMASKKPVIVSSICGGSEVLKDKREALFITPGNTRGISAEIKRIIEDEELRNRLADRGYNFVKENLSWHKYIEGMEEIFLHEA